MNTKWLIFTDLDGTLLDHDTYSSGNATQTIQSLQDKEIPVIFNTSKTYYETVSLQQTLGVHDPFIVESGSCIYLPIGDFSVAPKGAGRRDNYWEITLGRSQQEISHVIEAINIPASNYTRLSKCTVDSAVALTGLTSKQAEQAIAREFSEPLIWHGTGSALESFQKQLAAYHLTTLQGGRFLHVLGDCDKGRASILLAEYFGQNTKIIALGDSANDAGMLSIADIPIIVSSPSSHQLEKMPKVTIRTSTAAPDGWVEGVNKALSMI